jgi:hypothetical protein
VSIPVLVSDHALVRYLARVGGFDIEKLRHDLSVRLTPAAELGAHAVISEGMAYILRDNVLVTVVPHVDGNCRVTPRAD